MKDTNSLFNKNFVLIIGLFFISTSIIPEISGIHLNPIHHSSALCETISNAVDNTENNGESPLLNDDVPGIEWIDTRAITTILREEGVQVGLLKVYNPGRKPNINKLKEKVKDVKDPNLRHLASEVSTQEIKTFTPHNAKGRIVLLDLGVKNNILSSCLNIASFFKI